MNDQLTLDAALVAPNHPPYQKHSDTSRAAAASMADISGRIRLQVLDAIRYSGNDGRTALELEAELHIDGDTIRPRIVELMNAGAVIDSGERRKTASGRNARVLVSVNR